SGISFQTSYRTAPGWSGKPVFPDTDKAFSTGIDFSWKYDPDKIFNQYLVYSLSWTKYFVRDLGWIDANTDVRHTFKGSFSFVPVKRFLISSNLFVFFDRPFTPYKVVDTDSDGVGDSLVPEKVNSARDLIPRYRFDLQIKWKFKLLGGNGNLFLNTANLLSFLNPVLYGIKRDKKTIIGASTRDFENRDYQFQGKPNSLLQSEIGISITY
ncbi:MAG: hypothetical protein GXP33_01210, partial [Spirochaetes bacterium]|nr:hypothetical protein [Spirochaetota bacterium]